MLGRHGFAQCRIVITAGSDYPLVPTSGVSSCGIDAARLHHDGGSALRPRNIVTTAQAAADPATPLPQSETPAWRPGTKICPTSRKAAKADKARISFHGARARYPSMKAPAVRKYARKCSTEPPRSVLTISSPGVHDATTSPQAAIQAATFTSSCMVGMRSAV